MRIIGTIVCDLTEPVSESLRLFCDHSDNPTVTASVCASKGSVISAALPGRWIWIPSTAPTRSATAIAARASRQSDARKSRIADPAPGCTTDAKRKRLLIICVPEVAPFCSWKGRKSGSN